MILLSLALTVLFGAQPGLATEADLKESDPANRETSKPEEAASGKADSTPRPDTSVCVDETVELTIGVNTLEDIFSLSSANMAAILDESAEKAGEKKPAPDEVRWQAVETVARKTGEEKTPADEPDHD